MNTETDRSQKHILHWGGIAAVLFLLRTAATVGVFWRLRKDSQSNTASLSLDLLLHRNFVWLDPWALPKLRVSARPF